MLDRELELTLRATEYSKWLTANLVALVSVEEEQQAMVSPWQLALFRLQVKEVRLWLEVNLFNIIKLIHGYFQKVAVS